MKITNSKPEAIILSAVRQYVNFLAPTYGPAGKKILIIESEFSHKAVDDGRMSSQAFEIKDELENAVVQYIKETTEKTYQRVKDGTTTSALIMGAIVEEAFKDIDNELKDTDSCGIVLELKKGLEEAVKKIEKSSKEIKTKEELHAIALNSFNDEAMAKLVSTLVLEVGKEGIIAIEDSQGMETECEVVQGLELAKGYASPYLINTQNNRTIIKNPLLLLVNHRIETFNEIVPILKQALEAKRQIAIIAEGFGEGTMTSIITRKFMSQGNFNPLLIETPGYGADKLETLKDIAVITGGKVVDKQYTLENITLNDLGQADSIDASKDKTIILGGKGKKTELNAHIETLKVPNANKYEQEKLTKRIAALTGGIAVLKVGAHTENEQKWLKAKLENAVNATQLAFKEGVVAGGGKTYDSLKTSSEILNVALKAPRKQLEKNGKAYLDDKVVDPTGVLVAGLETAVSIASGLITMGGISVPKRKYDESGNAL